MTVAFASQFKLAGPLGDGRHPYANGDGAFVGRGVPLLEREALGRWKPRDDAVLERLLAVGYGVPIHLGWRSAQLGHVAAALNEGNIALACISLLRMQLRPLPTDGHARAMAKADELLAKDNPDWEDEPRVPAGNPDGGQWTTEDGADEGADIQPAAAQVEETQARKERFVDAHLADAQETADRRRVPVENIIGLSAVESGWGRARFAIQGNNLFGIHYPAPYATGYLPAQRSTVRVATFTSFADSLRSFTAIAGSLVRGISNPSEFGAALQNSGKSGIDTVTGQKKPDYVPELAATIRGLRPIISRRRA